MTTIRLPTANDDKLIEFCAFILSHEGNNINAEQYWQMFSEALNRKLEVTITHDFPQAILTEEEGQRIAKAMEIAEKRVKSHDAPLAPAPNT